MSREVVHDHRVLMITYAFPPAAYVGGYRTLKYCKYLRDYGWSPLVLTIKPTGVTHLDENLCRQLPDHVRVYRTFDIDPAKWLEKLSRLKAKCSPSALSRTEVTNSPAPRRRYGIWKRLKRLLESLLTKSPDSHVFWVPFAFFKGLRILLKEKVDVIHSTSPPHSSHIAAFLLAKCCRKPYVLDFRDPWFVIGLRENPFVKGSRQSPCIEERLLLKLEAATKRLIVRGAAKIICVSRGERDEMREEFPELQDERFEFITNGYDPTDFSNVNVSNKVSTKLTLTHAGTIYGGTGGEFFEALHQLLANHPGIGDRIQVNLLGEITDEYAATIRELETCGILRAYGMQPHDATLRVLFESDVLVIMRGGGLFSSSHIAAKVFEYLYTQKPILAITNEGELAEIVKKSGLGIVVHPNNVEKLTQTLWDLCVDYTAGRLEKVPNQDYIRMFERAALTEKLAIILDEVKGAHNVRS